MSDLHPRGLPGSQHPTVALRAGLTLFLLGDRSILTPKEELLHQERAHHLPTQAQRWPGTPCLPLGPGQGAFLHLCGPRPGQDLAFQWSFLCAGIAFELKKVHSWVSPGERCSYRHCLIVLIQAHQVLLPDFPVPYFSPNPSLPFLIHPTLP